MANETAIDLPAALKKAGEELARQISDATELLVDTKYVLVDDTGNVDWNKSTPVARTVVKLDGDTELIIPMTKQGDTLVLRKDLLELHNNSVTSARAYREKLYDMMMSVAREIAGR